MRSSLALVVIAFVSASSLYKSTVAEYTDLSADYSIDREWREKPGTRYTIEYPLTDCVRASDKACVDAIVARHGVETTAAAAPESINMAVKSSNMEMVRYLFDMFDGVYRVKGFTSCPFVVISGATYATTDVFKTLLSYYENYFGFDEEPLTYALRYSAMADRTDNASYVIETYNTSPGFPEALASAFSWAVNPKSNLAGLSVLLDFIEPRLDQYEQALEWTLCSGMYHKNLSVITYVLDRLHAHSHRLQKYICTALQNQYNSSTLAVIKFLAWRYTPEYLARGYRGLLINAARRGRNTVVEYIVSNFLVPHPELGGAAVAVARKSAIRHRHSGIAELLQPFDKASSLN